MEDYDEDQWIGGLLGGECDANEEGTLIDFNSKGKYEVSCMHFTDGQTSWRGVVDKIVQEKCYFHDSTEFARMYCICNTDDCNSNSGCNCNQCMLDRDQQAKPSKDSKPTLKEPVRSHLYFGNVLVSTEITSVICQKIHISHLQKRKN